MSALYGRLQGARGPVTRCGTPASGISAKLETWHGSIRVDLESGGVFRVWIGPKHDAASLIAEGNVDEGKRHANLSIPGSIE